MAQSDNTMDTNKYNSRDAEVEPRNDESEYGVINFRRAPLKKGDQVEAAMHEDNKEEGSNGIEV